MQGGLLHRRLEGMLHTPVLPVLGAGHQNACQLIVFLQPSQRIKGKTLRWYIFTQIIFRHNQPDGCIRHLDPNLIVERLDRLFRRLLALLHGHAEHEKICILIMELALLTFLSVTTSVN